MPTPESDPGLAPTLEPPPPELLHLLAPDRAELAHVTARSRVADIAAAIDQLPARSAARVIQNLPPERAARVLAHPDLRSHSKVLEHMDRDAAGRLLTAMPPDRRADLVRELPGGLRRRIVEAIAEPARSALRDLLRYDPRSAAGIMTTDLLTVPATSDARAALESVRSASNATVSYGIFVVDPDTGRLVRTLTLHDLVAAPPATQITALGDERPPLHALTTTSREDVARMISRYDLLALPVLDQNGRLVGMVTVDDVVDALLEEATEDVQRLGGLEALDRPYLRVSLPGMIRKRAGWLSALFLGEMLTATAMGRFEGEIARAVVLSLFIPLIISSGGNSGSQATSLIIRAMALGEVRLRDWWRVALRELPSGIALGVILGAIGSARVLLWQHLGWYDYGPHFALVALTIGLTLIGVVTFGSLAGSMLPFVLRRLGFDPASASAPFVATLVDVTGLVIYFSVAFLVLQGTLL